VFSYQEPGGSRALAVHLGGEKKGNLSMMFINHTHDDAFLL
jgi:hypothetical protein